jgi:hypothetical protein
LKINDIYVAARLQVPRIVVKAAFAIFAGKRPGGCTVFLSRVQQIWHRKTKRPAEHRPAGA